MALLIWVSVRPCVLSSMALAVLLSLLMLPCLFGLVFFVWLKSVLLLSSRGGSGIYRFGIRIVCPSITILGHVVRGSGSGCVVFGLALRDGTRKRFGVASGRAGSFWADLCFRRKRKREAESMVLGRFCLLGPRC